MWKPAQNPKEIQVETQSLSLGMYVTRLDKPSLDAQSDFEGMYLNTPEDIARLQRCCDHVYIDPERSERYAFPLIPATVEP